MSVTVAELRGIDLFDERRRRRPGAVGGGVRGAPARARRHARDDRRDRGAVLDPARGPDGRLRARRRPRGARPPPRRADLDGRDPRAVGQRGARRDPRRRAEPRGADRRGPVPRPAVRDPAGVPEGDPRVRPGDGADRGEPAPAREARRARPDVGGARARAQQPGGGRQAHRGRARRRARHARRGDGRRSSTPASSAPTPRSSSRLKREAHERARSRHRARRARRRRRRGRDRRLARGARRAGRVDAGRAARLRRPRRGVARPRGGRRRRRDADRRPLGGDVAQRAHARRRPARLDRPDVGPRQGDQGLHLHGPGRPPGGRRPRRARRDADDPQPQAQAHADRGASKRYDRFIPHVCVFGSELNQVWTNLLDNAIDALGETRHDHDHDRAVARVRRRGADRRRRPRHPRRRRSGASSIRSSPRSRSAPGTGLGLDTAVRIVRDRHDGDVRLRSRPGETVFTVRLPRAPSKA